jgi:hypothetical protein
MALHAETVGILIEKGRFEPEVALGIAEAIETSMTHAQFVTVPILDARLQELRADTRIALMSIENKLSTGFQEVDAKIDRTFADLVARMEGTKAELVRWVFLVLLGNVALGAGAAAMLEAVKHF